MKIIFLDFDGVINNWNNFDMVDEKNVKILKKIIQESGAKVIATTSNKYSFQRDKSIDICSTTFFKYLIKLKEFGIDIDGVTPMVNCDKTLEIAQYIKSHKDIEQYVILDDEIIADEFIQHQVFLDLYNGLQVEHIEPALNILNGRLGFYPKDYDRTETIEEKNLRINNYYNGQVKQRER